MSKIIDLIDSYIDRDPAAKGRIETLVTSPGLHSIGIYRLSSKVLADTTLEITKNRNINTISNEDGNYYSKIPIKKYLKAKKHFKHIGEK